MQIDNPPQGNARHFIVLLALLQGLLLYIASKGSEAGWWPFSALGGRVFWYTLVLTVPTVMMLSLVRLRDARFWQHAVGLLVAFGALASWAAWVATGQPAVQSSAVLSPFGWTVALGAFIATPYLQARLAEGRWCAPYPRLFQDAWQNMLTLVLAVIFVGLGWGVLYLWAELFKLIGVEFFATLFKSDPFQYLASGLLFGLGVLIGRTQHRAIFTTRSVLFALFKGLLPVVSFVALMFLVTLPFTGLGEMWAGEQRTFRFTSVAVVLALLIAHQVLFLNAVFQDGTAPAPYPHWLRVVVKAALVAMPLFALLGLWAVAMRVGQYGWTPDRFWALMALGVLLLYAVGYAVAVFRPRGGWLHDLPRINVGVSLVILGVVVLGNSPVLDPHRLAAGSQLARLEAMPVEDISRRDVEDLRFEFGRHGVRALGALRVHVEGAGGMEALDQIDRALARETRYTYGRDQPDNIQLAIDHLRQPENATAVIPADLLPAMRSQPLLVRRCGSSPMDCWVQALDLNFDGQDEQLVCAVEPGRFVQCWAFLSEDGDWSFLAMMDWYQDVDAVEASVRRGTLQVRRPDWGQVVPDGGQPRAVQAELDAEAVDNDLEAGGVQ